MRETGGASPRESSLASLVGIRSRLTGEVLAYLDHLEPDSDHAYFRSLVPHLDELLPLIGSIERTWTGAVVDDLRSLMREGDWRARRDLVRLGSQIAYHFEEFPFDDCVDFPFGEIGPGAPSRRLLDYVTGLAEHPVDEVRAALSGVLGIFDMAEAPIPPTIAALENDGSELVRKNFRSALERRRWVPALDPPVEVRGDIDVADLGQIIERLSSEDRVLRKYAEEAFLRLADGMDDPPVELLTRLLRDDTPGARSAALAAFQKLGPKARGCLTDIMRWGAVGTDHQNHRRSRAAAAVASVGARSAAEVAMAREWMNDDPTDVRAAAASALATSGEAGRPAIPDLLALLRLAQARIDEIVARVPWSGRMGGQDSFQHHRWSLARTAAESTLRRLWTEGASSSDELIDLLTDPARVVREAAASALLRREGDALLVFDRLLRPLADLQMFSALARLARAANERGDHSKAATAFETLVAELRRIDPEEAEKGRRWRVGDGRRRRAAVALVALGPVAVPLTAELVPALKDQYDYQGASALADLAWEAFRAGGVSAADPAVRALVRLWERADRRDMRSLAGILVARLAFHHAVAPEVASGVPRDLQIQVLGTQGAPFPGVEELPELLASEDGALRIAAIVALCRLTRAGVRIVGGRAWTVAELAAALPV